MDYINYNSRRDTTGGLLPLVMIITLVLLLAKALLFAVDSTITNQDIMLCESAKTSGNEEYLKKCSCYYRSGDITCLQNN